MFSLRISSYFRSFCDRFFCFHLPYTFFRGVGAKRVLCNLGLLHKRHHAKWCKITILLPFILFLILLFISYSALIMRKKKKNEFVPPLLEEIKKYCQDKNLNVDTEHWYNYYEANDWKVNNRGKLVPMKNWKQALLTWHNNSKRYNINKSKVDSENVYSRKMTDKEIDECIAIMDNINKG